ncbi:UDP-N-acetylmuramoyl-L-alanyl-D-glutamate--2,6-diaminopimelate ligase [Bacillaceae bacterium W0354]
MRLYELLKPLKIYKSNEILSDISVTSIEMDSRQVAEGSLFVCIKGTIVDGHDFVQDAEKNGACAILAEKEVNSSLPVILVPSTVKALAIICDQFYGHPSHKLNVIGVTGTNGKTTLTYLLDDIFTAHGHKTGIIGTIDMKIGDKHYPVKNTTPDALFLQKSFKKMVDEEIDTVIMEVSSHALHMGRVYGVDFDTAVFTNLTQDHLDYHLNMNDYAYAKSLLFSQLGNEFTKDKTAIINIDDRYSSVMQVATSKPVIPYGFSDDAYVRATNMKLETSSSSFDVELPKETFSIRSNMTGKFNIYNMLAAISVAYAYQIPTETVKNALENTKGVPGRFEAVHAGQSFSVIVDYAHTPDSLENVLQSIVEIKKGKVITVVGCGGDRDRTKRPIMADVSVKYSDVSIFTSDNPRTEDPNAILKDMTGHLSGLNFQVITDRKQAIRHAINSASNDDVILIAGKGHETYQEINGKRIHFDDREIARTAINERLKEQS